MRFAVKCLLAILFGAALAARGDVTLLPGSSRATIQAALDSITDGSKVNLPMGEYSIDGTIYVTNNVKLVGEGMNATILKAASRFDEIIYMNKASAVVTSLCVTNAQANSEWQQDGIAVRIISGRMEYSRVTGTKNTWNYNRQGSVSLEGANAVLSHCRIDHNSLTYSGNAGGGVVLKGAALVENCLIDHNTATYAGGLKFYSGSAGRAVNCTIVDNTDNSSFGGGIRFDSASAKAINCLVRRNIGSKIDADIQLASAGTVKYCASVEGAGTNPVSADPEFTDPDNGDYTLTASSPCIDAGSESEATTAIGSTVAKDYAGATRVMGSEIEIGCYEFDPTQVTCAFAVDKSQALQGSTFRLTAYTSGFGSATDVAYSWSLLCAGESAPVVKTGSPLDFTPDKVGYYSISLTAQSASAGKQATASRTDHFYVAPLTNYVTNAKDTTPTFPYATPETATRDLAAAIDAAIDGTVIQLATGKVEFVSGLLVKYGITIQGHGMTNTVLYSTKACNPAIQLNHADSMLRDMTIAHTRIDSAWKDKPLAVWINSNGGTMLRCRVTDADATGKYSGHGAVWMNSSAGLVSHCVFDNNTICGSGNCGGGAIDVGAGLVENCLIYNNTSDAYTFGESTPGGGGMRLNGGKAVNCTIYGNKVTSGVGGGVSKSKTAILENCIVYGNTAPGDTTDPTVTGAPNLGNSTNNVFHCLVGQQVGTNPIAGVPEFMDAPNNDYHLATSSPCRDVAEVDRYLELLGLATIDGEVDLDGFTRLSGKKIDSGCYEYDASQVSCAFTVSPETAFVPAEFILVPAVEGVTDPTAATLTWTFTPVSGGDPVVVNQTGTNEFHQVLTDPDKYKINLKVSYGGKTCEYTRGDTIYAAATVNYVTNKKVGTARFPYGTPETAATNIQDAISASVDGASIRLPAGQTDFSSSIRLDKAITLFGEGLSNSTLYATAKFGQALVFNNANAVARDFTLTHQRGSSGYVGMAVDFEINGGTLLRCRVTDCGNNGAYYVCGVINMRSSWGRISHCIVDHCECGKYGGGNVGGGAVHMSAGLIDNTVISDNYSTYYNTGGGGLSLIGGTAVNCTIYGNTFTGPTGGGVWKSASAILENCIVYGNSAPNDTTDPTVTGAPNLGGSTENVNHCLVGQQVGTDPIAGEPGFLDAPNDDFHLVTSSPCRDVAEVDRYLDLLGLATIEGEVDVYGFTRLSGEKIDAGASEYDALMPSCAFSVDTTEQFVPATFTFVPTVENFPDPDTATITWTITPVHGGAATVIQQTGTGAFVRTISDPDKYTVSMVAVQGDANAEYQRPEPIYAASRENFVIAGANPDCAYPYATEATAATNLADAVGASVDGAVVWLSEGTHIITNTLLVDKAVVLVGAARDMTVLRPKSVFGALLNLNHPQLVVSNLTIAGGQAYRDWQSGGSASGVEFLTRGGTLACCRVTECGLNRTRAVNYSSEVAAIFVHSTSGVVTRCVIDNIDGVGYMAGSSYHCGGCGVLLTAGRIDNSVISNVTGVVRDVHIGTALNVIGSKTVTPSVVNCTIISNREYLALGGAGVHVSIGQVHNTIISDNYNHSGAEVNISGEETRYTHSLSPSFTKDANNNVIGRPVFYPRRPLVQTLKSPGWRKGAIGDYGDILVGGTDLLGRPRVSELFKSGNGYIDIGCTESHLQVGFIYLVR